jgi:adenylate cyclase
LAVSLDDLPAALTSSQELESVIDTSLRVIMLSSLGRMITRYLDSVAVTGAATNLTLFDDAGRTYYSTDRTPPPPHVVGALATGRTAWAMTGSGIDERVRIVQPLLNDKGCVRCHGSDSKLRGAVTVSLSTGHAAELRVVARRRAVVVMCVALATILALLYFLLGYLVIRPVRQIGDVAEAVGHGNLDVVVRRAAADGDEVSRLGRRVNDMIIGLRTELEMRRFVSKGTAKAARGAAGDPIANVAPVQSRRASTVLFTDIRGFTAYSETVSPERVVAMLNRLLQAQADVVERYGGDIDKYVGDELMAVFEGDDAEARAVRCAIEMIEAVDQQRTEGEPMRVGAGISRGEVVHGPIGSKNRQDFTVIGDVVNIGARLCSAADGGEVIVSGAVRGACESASDIAFDQSDPLTLKGKREPFPAFRARRAQ